MLNISQQIHVIHVVQYGWKLSKHWQKKEDIDVGLRPENLEMLLLCVKSFCTTWLATPWSATSPKLSPRPTGEIKESGCIMVRKVAEIAAEMTWAERVFFPLL